MTIGIELLLAACVGLIPPPAASARGEPRPPEPPIRLRKKEHRPTRPPDAKPQVGREKAPETVPPETANPREVVARLSRNMRASSERLARADARAETRRIQREILKDLDALTRQARPPDSPPPGATPPRADSGVPAAGRTGGTNAAAGRRTSPLANARPPAGGEAGTGGNGTSGTRGRSPRPADRYKDIWGHLPDTLRQEIDQYSRDRFMPKYADLLKQYYATIAEKGSRKGD